MAFLAPDHKGVAFRRKQILDAAKQCFRSQGFHGASMSQIAANAGLSVGQIYRYFQNKETIVRAIVEDNLEETRQDVALSTSKGGDLAVSLATHMRQTVTQLAEQDCASLMFEVKAEAARNAKLGAFLKSADEECRARMRDLVCAACSAELTDGEIDVRVEMISVLFEGLLMRKLKRPDIDQDHFGPLLEGMIATVLQAA